MDSVGEGREWWEALRVVLLFNVVVVVVADGAPHNAGMCFSLCLCLDLVGDADTATASIDLFVTDEKKKERDET